MIIVIGLFGFISALALFIEAIILMSGGAIFLGIGLLLADLYIVALTVVLIRLDGNMTESKNRISKLEAEIARLKTHLNIKDEDTVEEETLINEEIIDIPEEGINGVHFCKNCGYQLFPEDKVCPNCNEKVEE